MKNNRVELLAPAGDRQSFIGAINAGADAVYIGGKNFGARKFASNFSDEEIVEMISYAHLREVKLYVTINTIIFENEMEEVIRYADFLVEHQVDALIVQDLGVVSMFVKRYPDTEIHLSTQGNVYNINQLKYMKKIGVSRVILARETSIDDIKIMKKEVDLDLEIFIHGALCVSYSGNCLFSSLNGGRSGNRGECAQPCRLKYKLYRDENLMNSDSYILSTKDLMTISNIYELISTGVSSLKIEGRMRKPEYVVATVRAYRAAIDQYYDNTRSLDNEKSIKEMKMVFNREYTKGYLLNEAPYMINNAHRPNHQGVQIGTVLSYNFGKTSIQLTDTLSVGDGIRILGKNDSGGKVSKILLNGNSVQKANQNDVVIIDFPSFVEENSLVMKTLDYELESSLKVYFDEAYKLVNIYGRMKCVVGRPIEVEIESEHFDSILVISDYIVEKAKNASQDAEKIRSQFCKFGNTFYNLTSFIVETDNESFIPNNVFNNLRREIIDLLNGQRILRRKRTIISNIGIDVRRESKFEIMLNAKVETYDQYLAAKNSLVDIIYVNEKVKLTKEELNDPRVYISMNRIWHNLDNYSRFDRLLINDVGALDLTSKAAIRVNYTLNTVNSNTVETLLSQKVESITMSLESSFENTKEIIHNYNLKQGQKPEIEVVIYGRMDLMLSKYCPITKSENVLNSNCNLCQKHKYYLADQNENTYSIIRDGECNVRIIHYQTLRLIDYLHQLINEGVTNLRLDFTDENYEETLEIINAYKNKMSNSYYILPDKKYTTGRFLR